MPVLAWDRLFETCVRQNANLVLLAGSPPFWRSEYGLRAGLVSPVNAADLESMYKQIVPPRDELHVVAGIRCFDLRYGADFKFRAAVFGHSAPAAILMTRLSPDAPPLSRETGKAWRPSGDALSWHQLFDNCIRKDMRDIVVMPEYPPVLWSDRGLHVFFVPALTPSEVASTVEQIVPSLERATEVDGYLDFSTGPGPQGIFRVASFGQPSPRFVILMRMPKSNQPPIS